MSRSLLRVRDLSVEFGPAGKGVRVLDRVGFDMAAGDCIGIVGESGSGKSVMSLSLLRLIPEPPGRIVEGSIEFDGVDLLTLPRVAHAGHPRQGDRHDLPGADERPQSGDDDRRADIGGDLPP